MPVKKTPSFRFKHLPLLFVVVAVASGVSACSSRLDSRGSLLDPERVAEIRPGEQTRQEVAEILGSPSSITTFGQDTWYYISKRTATFAFFAPKVTHRQIVVVTFNGDGKVEKIHTLGLEQGRIITPVERKTPTFGNEMTVLEQVIGNLGRFRQKAQEANTGTDEDVDSPFEK